MLREEKEKGGGRKQRVVVKKKILRKHLRITSLFPIFNNYFQKTTIFVCEHQHKNNTHTDTHISHSKTEATIIITPSSIRRPTKMKFVTIFSLSTAASVSAFTTISTTPTTFQRKACVELGANIRGPTEKSEQLRFGWDGTTALGGAVEVAKPSRMLEDIREAGEEIPNECEVFNANLEMSGDDVTFEEVIEVSNDYTNLEPLRFDGAFFCF